MKILKHLLFFVFLFSCSYVLSNPCSAYETLNWKGYTWKVSDSGYGEPGFGGWSADNIVGPDANGYLTFKMTNNYYQDDPIGAEMYSMQQGWGYGTYIVVIGSRLDNLDKNIVFGGMAPLYYDGEPWFEMDGSEASRWDDGSSDVLLSHYLWYGPHDYDSYWHGDDMSIASDAVQTHRTIWEPGKITFDAFLGTGTAGTNYFHTVITQDVPVPGNEELYFGLWAYSDGDPTSGDMDIPATSVIVRDFSFSAYSATHALTVNSGSGSGAYASGANITITANAPASGQVFDRWTGDTAYLSSTTASTATVTMPAQAIALTATYKAAPVNTYALSVVSGTGDGSYTAGTGVAINADAPAGGQVFDKWTGDTAYLSSVYTSTATVTMPAQAIALAATYKAAAATTYALVVNSGIGDGSYISGASVTITADSPAAGQIFDQWTGGTSYIASTTSTTTTVTMPSSAVTLTATYKAATATTYALTIISGMGSGSYTSGTGVTITADSPAAGQVFDRWTGDTTYLSSAYTSTATVTMPAKAIALAATYKAAAATTYALTVNSGTGDGSYTSGTGVVVTADSPPAGQVFDRWTGNTTYLSSVYTSTSTVTMPAQAIALTATYRTAMATTYLLIVNGGTGDGAYVSGASVTITASDPAKGQTFDQWTGDTTYLSSVYTANATITMPAKAITLTATYKKVTVTTYALNINSGTGDGSYTSGTGVTITADSPAAGQVFDRWTGDTTYLSSVYTSTATVTMPATAVTLTATFKNTTATTYKLNVVSGSGSGYYTAGTDVTISANTASTGKAFDRWTGDIDYVLSTRSASTKVTIPERDVNFTAIYKDIATTYPNGALIKVTGSSNIYVIIDGEKRWIPTIEAFEQLGYKWENIILVSQEAANAISDYKEDATITSYPNGTLIKTPDSFKVYVMISGKKKWIPTPEVFEQLGYQWTSIVEITREKINFVPDFEDNLIRSIGNYKVYLVVNGVKRHIPNPNIFLDYGFKWEEVKDVPQTTIDQYRDTYLIKQSRDGSIYYLAPQEIRKLIPTTEIFNAYNDKAADIQIISKTEMDSYPLANLIKLGGGSDIYLIEGNVKRRIPSAAIFDKYHLNWNYVMTVNQVEFNFYQTGAELK